MKIKFSLIMCLLIAMSISADVLVADEAKDNVAYVAPDSASLKFGRIIWLNNCEGCHGYGIADAPVPMQPRDWMSRVTKERAQLYSHAIDGFISEDYTEMPARGGNSELSDEQVKAAVDYMLFLANFYIKQQDYIN